MDILAAPFFEIGSINKPARGRSNRGKSTVGSDLFEALYRAQEPANVMQLASEYPAADYASVTACSRISLLCGRNMEANAVVSLIMTCSAN